MNYPEDFIDKVILGDCLEIIKQIPDKSINAIITDPPYGIQYYSGRYKEKNPFDYMLNDDNFNVPLDLLYGKLKDDGSMFIFHSHRFPIIDERIKNTIIWVKNNWTAGDLRGNFGNQYECISFFPKSKFKNHSRRYSNVWHFNRVPYKSLLHPTQKPIPLIYRLIEVSTSKGEVILDPFLGSGTTVVAAERLGRRWIGIEISGDYCEVAKKRVNSERRQTRLK